MSKNRRFASPRGGTKKLLYVLTSATLVVGALAVFAHWLFFPPRFRGWGEITPDASVAGWAVDRYDPSRRVEVQAYVDGELIGAGAAQLPRPDVVAAGWTSDERCGYSFPLPKLEAGEHEARVYALHEVAGGERRTLILTGEPLRFKVDESGAARKLSEDD